MKQNESNSQSTSIKLNNRAPIKNGGLNSHSSNTKNQESPFEKEDFPFLDIVCFSHLRWNFVFQRPQHLLSRFSMGQRVFFIEEPIFEEISEAKISEYQCSTGVIVLTPHLPHGLSHEDVLSIQKSLVDKSLEEKSITNYLVWYYTPMAIPFSRHLNPKLVVYDCMDELSAFKNAPKEILILEEELLTIADVVFTGGMNLYEYKKNKHNNIHGIPSSIDREHFASGKGMPAPQDQSEIKHPIAGFYGVIDERMDIKLLEAVASRLTEWNFVILGPVVKISHEDLPKLPNIHYLGGKNYKELPLYLQGWDVALLPFALNESTRFISPTKTPEYLAADKPVVSTAITDVVTPYGELGLVHIANNAEEFADKILEAYKQKDDTSWLGKVDEFLSQNSWDKTWDKMRNIILKTLGEKYAPNAAEGSFISLDGMGFPEVEKKSWMVSWKETVSKLWPKSNNTPGSLSVDDKGSVVNKVQSGINMDIKAGGTLMFDYLIVGAGFAGSVLAERLAKESNKKVLIIDKRDHIGGNAYDFYNEDGILIHKYGPHIFHTNSKEVFEYLGTYTKWRKYEHRVLASVDGSMVPIPINLDTINKLYGFNFNAFELEQYFESVAEHKDQILTSEDVVVSKVGRDLYEKFFRGYTRKQWGLDPSELNASVTARVPTRTNRDGRYFTDTYQAMPLHGYTKMFQNMLHHPNIKIMLNTDYKDIMNMIPYKEMIYTGPIDEFFNFKYGKLPYRSLEFIFETHDMDTFQPVGTVNYPNDHLYTRITDFKYLTGQQHSKTSIVYEFPKAEGDPYYPVPRPENNELYKKYEKLAAESHSDVHFVGRLATYKYYNMDQVVAQALALYKKIRKSEESKGLKLDGVKSKTFVKG